MARKHNQQTTPDYGDVGRYDTFPKLLAYNARTFPDQVVMREKEFGIWNEFTFADYQRKVRQYALGLHALGVTRGDCVGLLGANRPEWVWGEVAAHAIGATSLGIYKDVLGEEASYLIDYAQIKAIICEDEEQVDKLLELGESIPSVRLIVYCDPRGMRKYDDPRLMSESDLCDRGDALDREQPGLYDAAVDAGQGDDVSVLCTTSGTTSKPKLAMLQSGPFLRHCHDYLNADPKCPGDDYVSVLPLPWIMEQVYVVGQQLIARNIINFVEDEETTMADLREIGPTFVLLAPRVWESIAAEVRARMMDSTPLKRFMYDWGMKIGMKAAAENDIMLAEFNARNNDALNTLITEHGVELRKFSPEIFQAFGEAAEEVLAEAGATDELNGRIYESFVNFREKAMAWTNLSDFSYVELRNQVLENIRG